MRSRCRLIVIAAPVAGAEAELAAAGSAQFTEEAIAAQLSAYRQDRAGTLTAELRLEPKANLLTADLTLSEPQGGLVADLLDLPNRPAISAKLSGEGPLDAWKASLTLEANGNKVLDGDVAISRDDGGLSRGRRHGGVARDAGAGRLFSARRR